MKLRTGGCLFLAIGFLASPTQAQNAGVRSARAAYDDLEFEQAIVSAQRALEQSLTRVERASAYEVLALSYGALDSTRQAVDAFRELILIDPDREPDPISVSPRITALYFNALGQVLVIRNVEVEGASFVAGQGSLPIEFEIPRQASVHVDAVGGGLDLRIDSLNIAGKARVNWTGLTPDGEPVPPGRYQVIIEAAAGPDQYATQVVLEIVHGPVDSVEHITSITGRTEQEEMMQPGRNWKPLGIATLYTAIAAATSLALENTDLANPPRKEIAAVSFTALVTGLVMSLKKPDAVPVESAILYNQLLREQIEQTNIEISEENVERRGQTMLIIRLSRSGLPAGS